MVPWRQLPCVHNHGTLLHAAAAAWLTYRSLMEMLVAGERSLPGFPRILEGAQKLGPLQYLPRLLPAASAGSGSSQQARLSTLQDLAALAVGTFDLQPAGLSIAHLDDVLALLEGIHTGGISEWLLRSCSPMIGSSLLARDQCYMHAFSLCT